MNILKAQLPNRGERTLKESTPSELIPVIKDLPDELKSASVLIGGLAYNYWCKPRFTSNIDLFLLEIPFDGSPTKEFYRPRRHCLSHKLSYANVNILTPEFLRLPLNLSQKVLETYVTDSSTSLRIASPEALISLLIQRFTFSDQSQIGNLITDGHTSGLLKDWPITEEQRAKLQKLKLELLNMPSHNKPYDPPYENEEDCCW